MQLREVTLTYDRHVRAWTQTVSRGLLCGKSKYPQSAVTRSKPALEQCIIRLQLAIFLIHLQLAALIQLRADHDRRLVDLPCRSGWLLSLVCRHNKNRSFLGKHSQHDANTTPILGTQYEDDLVHLYSYIIPVCCTTRLVAQLVCRRGAPPQHSSGDCHFASVDRPS